MGRGERFELLVGNEQQAGAGTQDRLHGGAPPCVFGGDVDQFGDERQVRDVDARRLGGLAAQVVAKFGDTSGAAGQRGLLVGQGLSALEQRERPVTQPFPAVPQGL
ncbi:hypothetical protein [Micromonospora coerulea]|uniref:hypothetical protein n=1 Tax=Micromonospora coerulea TaxID=47856 RepID=UPI00190888D0|nr:hypothetical protein [Micromonospora veneta]